MVKKGAVMFVLLLCGGILFAQTAADIDLLLDAKEITYAQAVRFVLPAAGLVEDNISNSAAFAFAVSRGWLSDTVNQDDRINMGALSLIIMKSFNLDGGLLYRLFPSPRYAFREMVYYQLIQGRSDPSLFIAGNQLLHILGRTLSFTGEAL